MIAPPELHVDIIGEGPDVVFFHGWGMNSEVWQQTAQVLSKKYRVTLIDFPGFGKNRKIHCDFQLDSLTNCVLSYVPSNAVVVAWSMGGLVAMNIVLKYPEHISKLVLVASSAQFVESIAWPAAMKKSVLDGFVKNLSENFKLTLQRFLMLQARGGDNAKETIRMLKQRLYQYGEPDEAALKGGLKLLENSSFVEQLKDMNLPVLLMFGKLDALVPIAAAEKMAVCFPCGQLVIFAKAAHAPFLSHFDEFINALNIFLALNLGKKQ